MTYQGDDRSARSVTCDSCGEPMIPDMGTLELPGLLTTGEV
jgi:hypothetical protein